MGTPRIDGGRSDPAAKATRLFVTTAAARGGPATDVLAADAYRNLLLGSLMFEDGDSRNIGGAMCLLATAPVALVCGVMGIVEATRPRGLRALLRGTLWSALLVGGLCGSLWAIIHFKLLRR